MTGVLGVLAGVANYEVNRPGRLLVFTYYILKLYLVGWTMWEHKIQYRAFHMSNLWWHLRPVVQFFSQGTKKSISQYNRRAVTATAQWQEISEGEDKSVFLKELTTVKAIFLEWAVAFQFSLASIFLLLLGFISKVTASCKFGILVLSFYFFF